MIIENLQQKYENKQKDGIFEGNQNKATNFKEFNCKIPRSRANKGKNEKVGNRISLSKMKVNTQQNNKEKKGRNDDNLDKHVFSAENKRPRERVPLQQKIVVSDYSKFEDTKLLTTYGAFIYSHMKEIEKQFINPNLLFRHNLSVEIRTKMVDWIIEVFLVFNYSDKTFFTAVHILDTYISKTDEILQDSDIHLIGMTCMFLASKFEESKPIRLEFLVKCIGYETFSKEQILSTERKIFKTIQPESLISTSISEVLTCLFFDFDYNNKPFIEQYQMKDFLRILEFNSIYFAKLITHFPEFNAYPQSFKAITCIVTAFDQMRHDNTSADYDEYYIKEWLKFLFKENNCEKEVSAIYKQLKAASETYSSIDYIGCNLNAWYNRHKDEIQKNK